MKKRFLAFLLLPLFAFVTADWVTIDLDNRVSINFPSTPKQMDSGGNPMWVQDVDKNSRCMAVIIDFADYGIDSISLAEEFEKEESIEQFKTSLLGEIPGASLISEKITTTLGKKTIELEIDMGKKDSTQLNKMYTKSIIAGVKMYSFSFFEKKELPQPELRSKFFNSVKIK